MALRPDRPQSRAEQLAQRAVAQQDAFLREVDDALREDEMFGAFKRYAKPVGGAIALGLAALAGGLWWNSHREAEKAERAEEIVLALDKLDAGQPDAASTQLDALARNGGDGSQSVARLLQAAIAARAGKADVAAGLYQSVSGDSSAPKPFRELATIRDVALRFDRMSPEDIVAKLKPLAAPGGAWFGSAGELLAGAYLRQGRKDLAGPLLVAIARDDRVGDTLRARTRQLAGLLGFDAIDDIAKAQADGPVSASPAGAAANPAGASGGVAPQAQEAKAVPSPRAPSMRGNAPANVGPIVVNLPSPAASVAPSSAPASNVPAPSKSPAP